MAPQRERAAAPAAGAGAGQGQQAGRTETNDSRGRNIVARLDRLAADVADLRAELAAIAGTVDSVAERLGVTA